MYNWETVGRTMMVFLICIPLTRGFIETKRLSATNHPYFKLLRLIKSFTNLLDFDITSISGKSVGRTQKPKINSTCKQTKIKITSSIKQIVIR